MGFNITSIEPHYDFTIVGGGHFKIKLEGMEGQEFYTLSFVHFLEDRLKRDEDLYKYIEAHHRQNTLSKIIQDLYSLAAPIQEWIYNYLVETRHDANPPLFRALLNLQSSVSNLEASGSAGSPIDPQ